MRSKETPGCLQEGVKLIFDQDAPSSHSASSRSSSKSSSSSSRGSRSSRSRSSSSQSTSSESDSSSNSRSRSRPRCSGRSHCRHLHRSPPRRYRARSRSFSTSPERMSSRRHSPSRYRYSRRSPSPYRYSKRSPPPYRYSRRYRRSSSSSRSRSRSPVYWRGSRYVGRYRCRFSRSPRSNRFYRSQSRSPERSSIRLSMEEKRNLLNMAKANATRILGVKNIELPASLKEMVEKEERSKNLRDLLDKEDRVNCINSDSDAEDSQVSPKSKSIIFSANNSIARPSNSPVQQESKVTSRIDSVSDRRPYGQWLPIGKSSKLKH